MKILPKLFVDSLSNNHGYRFVYSLLNQYQQPVGFKPIKYQIISSKTDPKTLNLQKYKKKIKTICIFLIGKKFKNQTIITTTNQMNL